MLKTKARNEGNATARRGFRERKRIALAGHLSPPELKQRYCTCAEPLGGATGKRPGSSPVPKKTTRTRMRRIRRGARQIGYGNRCAATAPTLKKRVEGDAEGQWEQTHPRRRTPATVGKGPSGESARPWTVERPQGCAADTGAAWPPGERRDRLVFRALRAGSWRGSRLRRIRWLVFSVQYTDCLAQSRLFKIHNFVPMPGA